MQPIARRFLSVLAGLLIHAVLFIAWHGAPVLAAGPTEARLDLSSAPAALVMISDPGCPYCARWEREVGPAYMASDDGKLAPLVRRDRRDEDIRFIERVVFSPTFVLLVRGREMGRIVGYSGRDLFWMQLAPLMEDVRAAMKKNGARGPESMMPGSSG